jgi:hypothetical protein
MAWSLEQEAHAPVFGVPLVTIDLDLPAAPPERTPGVILLGVDAQGSLPQSHEEACDLLLTTAADAPRPWVSVSVLDTELAALDERVRRRPLAASTLAQLLRIGAGRPVADALIMESLAYSALLGGSEFRNWRNAHPRRRAAPGGETRIRLTRDEKDHVSIHLANPERLNAFDARMRDDLVEALHAVADDPSVRTLSLHGDGRAFSSGGDLDEFGTMPDTATSHAIRSLRSPALLVHELRDRTTACLHGACIGAGIEFTAAAGRVVAEPDSWFQLPELEMGLIPGAGGTVTVPRRIGRHRALYWMLTGKKLDAERALDWLLIDEIGSPA